MRAVLLSVLLLSCAGAICAASASAQTFFVNQRNGENTPNCGLFAGGHEAEKKNPCLTIAEAVEKTEGFAAPNTVLVNGEEGPYVESLELATTREKNLVIAGEEAGVIISGHVTIKSPAGPVTFSNIAIRSNTGTTAAVAETSAELTLDDVAVENGSTSGKNGVEAHKGALAINGGSVEMENGAVGFGVDAIEAPLTVTNATVKDAGLGEAGGISSERSGLSVSGSKIIEEGGLNEPNFGLVAEEDGSVSLREDTVVQDNKSIPVLISDSRASVDGLAVRVEDVANKQPAIDFHTTPATQSTFAHLAVSGTWTGQAMFVKEGGVTVTDSSLATKPEGSVPAMTFVGPAEGAGLVIQRSVLSAGSAANRGTLTTGDANVTLDSSEILGGANGIFFESANGAPRTLTVAASTVDAGAPGILNDAFETTGVDVVAKGSAASVANVSIQGSIVLEQQVAQTAAGAQVTVGCSYTAVPSQSQAASATAGAIGCQTGAAGNTGVSPLASLFAEPFTNYVLTPGSGAVDSVPAAAVALPLGTTPSATDLAGNPRVVDGNGDCAAVQDKGALELQGHSAPCPPSPSQPVKPAPSPPKPSITGLSIAPGALHPAPSGATFARKTKYGAKLAWQDSEAATSTFTVVRLLSGRLQGHSCKRPSPKNRHGHRCTLKVKAGTFTHADRAGANSGYFSGRVKGRRLPAGAYQLLVVPRNAAGVGATASRAFKVI